MVACHDVRVPLPPRAHICAQHEHMDCMHYQVLEAILNAMASCMDGVGWLGGWIRDRFQVRPPWQAGVQVHPDIMLHPRF